MVGADVWAKTDSLATLGGGGGGGTCHRRCPVVRERFGLNPSQSSLEVLDRIPAAPFYSRGKSPIIFRNREIYHIGTLVRILAPITALTLTNLGTERSLTNSGIGHCILGGNGGLSIRTKSVILRTLEAFPPEEFGPMGPEVLILTPCPYPNREAVWNRACWSTQN